MMLNKTVAFPIAIAITYWGREAITLALTTNFFPVPSSQHFALSSHPSLLLPKC